MHRKGEYFFVKAECVKSLIRIVDLVESREDKALLLCISNYINCVMSLNDTLTIPDISEGDSNE